MDTGPNGNKNYWTHIINAPGVPWWLKLPVPLMPFVEILGMFTKPFVLAVRLFANMTAGHIIALVFYSLIFIFWFNECLCRLWNFRCIHTFYRIYDDA